MKKINLDLKAAGITLGVHALLLLLCILIGYTLPAKSSKIEELGIEVNLGNSTDGSGIEQAFSTNKPEAETPNNAKRANETASSEQEKDLLEDPAEANAPSINQSNKEKKNTINPTKAKEIAAAKPKILFPDGRGQGGNAANINQAGRSEGNGQGEGDKGVPGGTAGATNYEGIPGSGTGGIGHSFSDRTIVASPDPKAEFKEGGKVVIRVTVNRQGIITNQKVTKASNPELKQLALEKLSKVRFSKSETAPVEQFGDITFVFKPRTQR